MFPHQGNPTIAGIYDLLEIIIERLNRIEYNQDKERISRALGSACNEHHYLSDTLARARPEPYSYNNHQHTSLQNQTMLSPQPSSYVIPSNRSGTSKTAEQSPNEDNVISNSGGDIEEDTYEQVQKQQSNLEESIQANPTLTLEHRRKRKLSSPQQLEQKNAKKNKQDKEYAPSQEVLASEEILSTEEGSDEDQQFTREVENSQKKHKQVRFKMKPQRVNENASSQEETGIKKERNNRPQTEKDSALEDDVEIIEHVHDNVIQTGKNNLPKVGISTTSRQKKTKVVIKNMKAREPQILTRRRRCVLEKREQQTINKSKLII
jgi:regulator of replication initiation timing